MPDNYKPPQVGDVVRVDHPYWATRYGNGLYLVTEVITEPSITNNYLGISWVVGLNGGETGFAAYNGNLTIDEFMTAAHRAIQDASL